MMSTGRVSQTQAWHGSRHKEMLSFPLWHHSRKARTLCGRLIKGYAHALYVGGAQAIPNIHKSHDTCALLW